MSISLIAWGRFFDADGNRVSVPAPPTDAGSMWLWDLLARQASSLAKAGFDRIQLPPASKAQGGNNPGSDGYGLFDPRDLGSKQQQGSVETRYGTAEQLRRMVAVAHANGLAVDLDVVLHQLDGGTDATYLYLGADGATLNGRGRMTPGCFRGSTGGAGTQQQDDVPDPADDYAFGDEKVYQHCDPPGYTIADALDWGDWLFRTTRADGGRIDDAKGIWAPFVAQFLSSGAMATRKFYAEYFDGNRDVLNRWATSDPLNGCAGVTDFAMHFSIEQACNGLSALPLADAGYANWNPGLAYGFVENPDTDTTPGEQVVRAKMLGYAYLLTAACREVLIYGKDYFSQAVWPGAYGLQPLIDNLVYINRTFAYGGQTTRWLDSSVIVIERGGQGGDIGSSPGLLTALNFDTYNMRQITAATSFGAGVQLHDYTGRHADIWTDSDGKATFTIPANAYEGGQSYLCFSRAGADRPVEPVSRDTTQVFFGAPDLDLGPAQPGPLQAVSRIYVEAGGEVTIESSQGAAAALLDGTGAALPGNRAPEAGWYGVGVRASGAAPVSFEVAMTYRAPRTLVD